MAIKINTNVSSIKLTAHLNEASDKMNAAMEKLSTGVRLNSPSVDAAGFQIAQGLKTQISGSLTAVANAEMGRSLMETAEGVLTTVNDSLMRIRDLVLEGLNGGYSEKERKSLETEVKARVEEIDRVTASAKFNDFTIFDTSKSESDYVMFQIGTEADSVQNTLKITGLFCKATFSLLTGSTLTASSIEFKDPSDAAGRTHMETLLDQVNAAIDNVTARATLAGTGINRLDSAVNTLTVQYENLSAAYSSINDADVAKESSEYTKQYIRLQTTSSLLAQANQVPSLALSLI